MYSEGMLTICINVHIISYAFHWLYVVALCVVCLDTSNCTFLHILLFVCLFEPIVNLQILECHNIANMVHCLNFDVCRVSVLALGF